MSTALENERPPQIRLPSAAENVAIEPRVWRPRSWPVRSWHGVCAVVEWLLGLVSSLATLALLAAMPAVNLVTHGYLLDGSGRVARSGRLRDGFVDIAKFARI